VSYEIENPELFRGEGGGGVSEIDKETTYRNIDRVYALIKFYLTTPYATSVWPHGTHARYKLFAVYFSDYTTHGQSIVNEKCKGNNTKN
jgi:hypothetical protein